MHVVFSCDYDCNYDYEYDCDHGDLMQRQRAFAESEEGGDQKGLLYIRQHEEKQYKQHNPTYYSSWTFPGSVST